MSKSIQGFKVIPIQFSSTSTTCHELFVKEHSVRNQSEDKPPDRTLFILNVPPYATEDSFKRVFSCVGPVTKVTFQEKPSSKNTVSEGANKTLTGFKVAYVIYQKSSSVQKALNLTKLEPLSTDDHPIITGIQKWAKEYNSQICDQSKLQQEVDSFMKRFDVQAEKQKQRGKQADDGGWTVVTKKGLSRKKSVTDKVLQKTQKGEKRKHLTDFYTFQKRESKMNHLIEMRRKYEEDKKKVNTMKRERKFRPF